MYDIVAGGDGCPEFWKSDLTSKPAFFEAVADGVPLEGAEVGAVEVVECAADVAADEVATDANDVVVVEEGGGFPFTDVD